MSKKIKYLSIIIISLVVICLSLVLFVTIGTTFALSVDVAYGATQDDLETINEKATETDVVEEIGTIQNYPNYYAQNFVKEGGEYTIVGFVLAEY